MDNLGSQFPKRKSPRAKHLGYDTGIFFITICTTGRKHFFGQISNGEMHLSSIGKIVNFHLENAAKFNPLIDVPLYVVMPNHIHFLICLPENDENQDHNFERRRPMNNEGQRYVPRLTRFVGSFKSSVTKEARKINSSFGWQARFHDHYIRGIRECNLISDYIINNVVRWEQDCFFG